MTLTLEVNGTEFGNFTDATVSFGMDQLAGEFSFTAVSEVPDDWPAKQGSEVRVLADGVAVLKGFVEIVRVRYNHENHSIGIRGRTRTADVVDSTITARKFSPPITMEFLVELVLNDLGIGTLTEFGLEGIGVINQVDDLESFDEDIDAKAGQTAFEFLEQYARKRQVLLTTSAAGDIVITRNTGTRSGITLTSEVPDAGKNNILSAFLNLNNTERFQRYEVRSSGNAVGAALTVFDANAAADVFGQATDDDIRAGRVMTFVAANSTDTEGCTKRADWEGNIRRTRSQEYTCVVQGHEQSPGTPWEFNQIVTVSDDFADVEGELLIDRVEMTYSVQRGSRTSLRCVPTDAYLVQAAEPEKEKETTSFGDIFKEITDEQ